MTGALLFARSRRWLANLVVIAACGILILVCGPLGYSLHPQSAYLVIVAAQVPLLCAITLQASMATATPQKDAAASRDLRSWRLAHIVVFTVLACVSCGIAAAQVVPPGGFSAGAIHGVGAFAIVRDVIAMTGAALACAALVGPHFGWVLPFAWTIIPYMALPSTRRDPVGIVTLMLQPDYALLPFIVAAALWVVGTALAVNSWGIGRAAQGRKN
jgi:hypothetical protein